MKPELKHPRVVVVAEAMTSEYQTAGKCLKGLLAAVSVCFNLVSSPASSEGGTDLTSASAQVVTSLFILSLVALRSQMDAPTYMIDEGDNLLVRPVAELYLEERPHAGVSTLCPTFCSQFMDLFPPPQTISSDPREASVNKDMRPLYPQCLAVRHLPAPVGSPGPKPPASEDGTQSQRSASAPAPRSKSAPRTSATPTGSSRSSSRRAPLPPPHPPPLSPPPLPPQPTLVAPLNTPCPTRPRPQASGLSSPFQQVVYLCNLLSPSFYKELCVAPSNTPPSTPRSSARQLPPARAETRHLAIVFTPRRLLSYPTVDTLPAALNIAPPAVGPSGLPSVHLKASLTDLERFPASLVTPNWPDFPRALEAWRKLEKIVFNPIFEGLVWRAACSTTPGKRKNTAPSNPRTLTRRNPPSPSPPPPAGRSSS